MLLLSPFLQTDAGSRDGVLLSRHFNRRGVQLALRLTEPRVRGNRKLLCVNRTGSVTGTG